jgi:hypothetical protein
VDESGMSKLDDELTTPFGIGVDATAMVFMDFNLASCFFFDVLSKLSYSLIADHLIRAEH